MKIKVVSSEEVIRSSRASLGLPTDNGCLIDQAFLAASLRRIAGSICPCTRSVLQAAALECLRGLGPDSDEYLRGLIADAIEGLIVVGDLLELGQSNTYVTSGGKSLVFAAPPRFVVRPNGNIVVLGLTSDDPNPVPEYIRSRIEGQGYIRVIVSARSEDLRNALTEVGLLEISEAGWLETPRLEPASILIERMERQLAERPPSGDISDIWIIDPHQRVDYYAGRWQSPKGKSGHFVARRSQDYGSDMWGYVKLDGGLACKFLEFPLRGSRWRGCDQAWHLQMALDHCRGMAQNYRLRGGKEGTYFDFFSPLPLWAQRRFEVLGRHASKVNRSLMSYWLPTQEVNSEASFIKKYLWLSSLER